MDGYVLACRDSKNAKQFVAYVLCIRAQKRESKTLERSAIFVDFMRRFLTLTCPRTPIMAYHHARTFAGDGNDNLTPLRTFRRSLPSFLG